MNQSHNSSNLTNCVSRNLQEYNARTHMGEKTNAHEPLTLCYIESLSLLVLSYAHYPVQISK